MLPAASVCLTCTELAAKLPGARLKLLPLPVSQVLPPLLLYCQVAPSSRPITVTVPAMLTPSLPLLPLSLASFGVGATGASRSMKNEALLTALLPQSSVCRTCTLPLS